MKFVELIQVEPYTKQVRRPTMVFISQIVRVREPDTVSNVSYTIIELANRETVHVDGDYAQVVKKIQAAAQ